MSIHRIPSSVIWQLDGDKNMRGQAIGWRRTFACFGQRTREKGEGV